MSGPLGGIFLTHTVVILASDFTWNADCRLFQ